MTGERPTTGDVYAERSRRRWRAPGLLCALALGVTACALPEGAEDAPVPVVDGWQAAGGQEAAGKPISENWLDDFQSDTLNSLIAEALFYNNDLAQAAARVDAAAAFARSVGAARFPFLDASASAARSRTVLDFGNGPDTVAASNLGWSLGASWEVDVWGRIRDATRAAKADAVAVLEDFADARLSISGAVANAWLTLIEAHQQTELSRRDVENRERSLRLIRRRFERGLSGSRDLRLARSDLAAVRAGLALDEQVERQSARALEVLLGRYPAADIDYPDRLPRLPVLTGSGIPIEILTRRPDLRAAERRLASAGFSVREARKALLPQITLTGTIGPSDSVLSDLFDAEEIAGNIIGGLMQPLFQGGRLRANIASARAQAEEALYFYTDAVLDAYREVEDALDAEAYLVLQEESLEIALEEAQASEALTERDYGQGLANIFDLLEAQARSISAESALITVRRTRLTNRVNLKVALAAPFSVPPLPPNQGSETP